MHITVAARAAGAAQTALGLASSDRFIPATDGQRTEGLS